MKLSVPNIEPQNGFASGAAGIIKNVLMCFAVTAVLLFIPALIITYANVPDNIAAPVAVIVMVISVMSAGYMSARRSFSKGWLSGAVSGLLYTVLLYCIGSLIFRNITFGLNVLTMLALGIFSGAFGGIIGINKKHKR